MNPVDLQIRLIFENEPARHAFMMKAIDEEDFVYRLAGRDSVILSQKNAERLTKLVNKFHGVAKPNKASGKQTHSDLPDREERIAAWNAFTADL